MPANVYATADEFKQTGMKGITVSDGNIPAIERALAAASRQIDKYTGWWKHGFWRDDAGSAAVVRLYRTECTGELCIPEGLASITGLVVKADLDATGSYETTLTSGTSFTLMPDDALTDGWPYTSLEIVRSSGSYFPYANDGRPTVQVTGFFGWPSVPPEVKEATILQAAMIFRSPEAPFGAAGMGDSGFAMRIGRGLHPTAAGMVSTFTKPAIG